MGLDSSDDFIIHDAAVNGERKNRADNFVGAFTSGFSEVLPPEELAGFNIKDEGERQPNGASCFFAAASAAARGMNATEAPFQQSVIQMFHQAENMGIVDNYGVVPVIAQKQISEILSGVGLEQETIGYLPNSMTSEQIKTLGGRVADGIKNGFGVAMLIPNARHYVLLHSSSQEGIQLYDPLNGSDSFRSIQQVALGIGNIVNGEMRGEMNTGNSITFFKPESDFIVEEIRSA